MSYNDSALLSHVEVILEKSSLCQIIAKTLFIIATERKAVIEKTPLSYEYRAKTCFLYTPQSLLN